jgi:hypothetical protein
MLRTLVVMLTVADKAQRAGKLSSKCYVTMQDTSQVQALTAASDVTTARPSTGHLYTTWLK